MALSRYFKHPFFNAGFDDILYSSPFFRDPFFASPSSALMPVLRNLDIGDDAVLLRSSPGYEIHERDNQYQISVDMPGVKASDISVDLEQDGRVLRIAGGRKVQKGESITETKFEKKFTIGENVDAEKMTANLADGVLVLQAPKRVIESKKVTIPITEKPHIMEGAEKK